MNEGFRPLSAAQEAGARKKLEQTFTQEEARILSSLGIRKTFAFFASLARKLCSKDRAAMQVNPRRQITEYCPACQEVCTREIKQFIEDNKT